MCLRFAFLLTMRLARREETWKTAEILILRHHLAVLQRQQPRLPKLTWADRALLASLFSVIPKARRQGLRLLVTPDTILRSHRDIVRRRQAARSMRAKTGRPPAGAPGPWCSGGPGRTPAGGTAGSVSVWGSGSGWIPARIWCWWLGLTRAGSGRFGVPCRGLVVPVAGTGPGSPCWP